MVVTMGGPVHLNVGNNTDPEEEVVIGRMEEGIRVAAPEFNEDETKSVSEDCTAATTAES